MKFNNALQENYPNLLHTNIRDLTTSGNSQICPHNAWVTFTKTNQIPFLAKSDIRSRLARVPSPRR
jgi:hypothetical protein